MELFTICGLRLSTCPDEAYNKVRNYLVVHHI